MSLAAIVAGPILVASITGEGVGRALAGPSPLATIDQSNPVRQAACRYVGWAPDDSASWAAQTFTAGRSGGLSDIMLPLRVRRSQRAVVGIAPTDAGGRPVVATPLASTTLLLPEAGYVDTTFSFSPPVRVRQGTQYAIVLSSPDVGVVGAANFVAWRDDPGSTQRDDAGTACADGAYGPGRAWASNDGLQPGADFFFTTYVISERRVTVLAAGPGHGTVRDSTGAIDCGATCSAGFLPGDRVTFTAVPDARSSFVGWTGGGCTASGECTVEVAGDVTVVATFARRRVALLVRTVGAGIVTSAPTGIRCGSRCRGDFPAGSSVLLKAAPARGWRFARWRGSCVGTRLRCRLTVTRTATAIASFVRA